jgi:hypothetical protein
VDLDIDIDTDRYSYNRREFFCTEEAQNQFYICFNLTKLLDILIKMIFLSSLELLLSFYSFFEILEANSIKLLIFL